MKLARRIGQFSFRHPIARTTVTNILAMAATMGVGAFLARGLGEEGRGHYAALVVWFGVALVLAEAGQSAAVTFFVARAPGAAHRVVATARRIMFFASVIVLAPAVALVPLLADGGRTLELAYYVALVGLIVNLLGAPYIYALQALSLPRWNLVRLSQPVVNLVAIALWVFFAPISVLVCAVLLVGSFGAQMALAWWVSRQLVRRKTAGNNASTRDLLSFGLKQASSAVPQAVSGSLDRIGLSQLVSASALGQYAVAQSVVSAAAPLGAAISSVVFPRMSAFQGGEGQRRKVELRILAGSAASLVAGAVLLVALSPWVIPIVFGRSFAPAAALAPWIAAPVVTTSLLGVVSTLLKGRGRPGVASVAHVVSLMVTLAAMPTLVGMWDAPGAALAAFAGSSAGLLLGLALLCWGSGRERFDDRPKERESPGMHNS